jgi:3-oxoacyl-[acyl-carrier protein] reductase
VNFSGGPPAVPVVGVAADTWRTHFEAMVLGTIGLTDLVLPAMRSRGWGRIITGTSSGAVAPIPNLGLSNSLRVALHGWSKTLAAEVGVDGVTANIVVPGRIATARVSELDATKARRDGTTAEAVARSSMNTIPLRRYGTPEEFGDTVAFLAGVPASYITGAVIRVDGGIVPAL